MGCYDTAPERFGHLIRSLHERDGQPVVVLVDEYDKPILDTLQVLFHAFFASIPYEWHTNNDVARYEGY